MAKVIDVVFGKRLTDSFYHINTEFTKRDEIEEDVKSIKTYMQESIKKIQMGSNLPDEVSVILNNIKTELDTDNTIRVNELFASLSYLGYELWFIFRMDLETNNSFQLAHRVYAMNKRLARPELPLNINNVQRGMASLFDYTADVNLATMVMDFVSQGKINITDKDLLGIGEIITSFEVYRKTKETALLDVSRLLKFLEAIDYKFIISLNSSTNNQLGINAESL